MEKIVDGREYRFKKDWSRDCAPFFYSAKKGDIVVFTGRSLCAHFRKLSDGKTILMSKKEAFKLLEEVEM